MTWHAGDMRRLGKARRHARGKKVNQGKRMERGVAKGLDQYDFQVSIADSINEITHEREHAAYERERMMRTIGRVREEREGLENLGLDETEAVEYVMWLSREECVKEVGVKVGTKAGEEVHEGDLENLLGDTFTPDTGSTSERAAQAISSLAEEDFLPVPRRSASGSPTPSNSSPSTSLLDSESGSVWGSVSAHLSFSTPSLERERRQSRSVWGSGQGASSSGTSASVLAPGWGDDDDLRFAIELSLAEAQSRGDVL